MQCFGRLTCMNNGAVESWGPEWDRRSFAAEGKHQEASIWATAWAGEPKAEKTFSGEQYQSCFYGPKLRLHAKCIWGNICNSMMYDWHPGKSAPHKAILMWRRWLLSRNLQKGRLTTLPFTCGETVRMSRSKRSDHLSANWSPWMQCIIPAVQHSAYFAGYEWQG